ncbi:LysR family transcriptional regulator [Amycolatopsis rubida]|uniref:LysR family transcriptional regulator n=1 Tax=Amycolatopsis rubida TaxID=112413 RepID=A0ABX0BHG5_9PSEU|nr:MULTISPECIES: LysR family transcriptional regulator [Amycolatopsis]MYW89778.1 LysR family transcriptional regulator [Amycolatopsis rubida]NEC54754.1 LysR family transcriptional regulator [Amycolatopsis rubida]OAP23240.1 HTH-type transcriptional regulator GltC [Amycolatopsis sp. M39]
MSPSLRQLEYLVAVADTGGLTAAADSCHVSQSAVSLAIASLERTLGVQLVLRGPGRATALTDAGRQVAGEARAVLTSVAELGATARDYGQDLAGRLNFGCYTPLAPLHVPAALATFRTQHPEVDVSFVEGTLPDLQHLVLEGRCDLAVLYRQDLVPGIAADQLYDQPPSVLLPLAHPLARRKTVSLRALADEPFVLLDVPPSERYFRDVFAAVGLPMPVAHRTTSFELARALVARGLGYTLSVQRPSLELSVEGTPFAVRPLRERVPTTPVVLARAEGARLTRRAETFRTFCREFFGART